MRTRTILPVLLLIAAQAWSQTALQKFTLQSPLKKLKIEVTVQDSVTYAVSLNGKPVLLPSAIALDFGTVRAGRNAMVKNSRKHNVRDEVTPLYGQFAKLRNDYNELESILNNITALFSALTTKALLTAFRPISTHR